MSSQTGGGTAPANRLGWVDALRGIAIVQMVAVHVYGVWSSSSYFYLPIAMPLGLAPVFFLAVVGMSMNISLARRGVTAYHWKRGLAIVAGGFSLAISAMYPEGFNIFHIIGAAILLLAAMSYFKVGLRGSMIVLSSIVVLTAAVNLLDPLGKSSYFFDPANPFSYERADLMLYNYNDPLFRFFENAILAKSSYPIFPWLAFAVVGYILCQVLLSRQRGTRNEIAGLSAGVALIIISILLGLAGIPVYKYPTTLNYVLLSVGSFMAATYIVLLAYRRLDWHWLRFILRELEFAGRYAFEIFIFQYFVVIIGSKYLSLGPDRLYLAMVGLVVGILLFFHVADRFGNRFLSTIGYYRATGLFRPIAAGLVAITFVIFVYLYYEEKVLGTMYDRTLNYIVNMTVSFVSVMLVNWYLQIIRRKPATVRPTEVQQ